MTTRIALSFFSLFFACNALRLNSPMVQPELEFDVQNVANDLRVFTKQSSQEYKQPLILMFANYGYRETLLNQMAGFHNLNVTNYAVICLDKKMQKWMKKIGRPCQSEHMLSESADLESIDKPLSVSAIWKKRMHVVHDLLTTGTSVLMTDADAVWLKNPMGFMKDADIVASRGSFPFKVSEKIGATACLGFAYFAGTPAVADFFEHEVMRYMKGDDQKALNEAFVGNHIDFGGKMMSYINSTQIDTGILPAKGDRKEIRVNFLDHYRFPRRCGPDNPLEKPVNEDTYVAHCNSEKNQGSKLQIFQERGLLWLTDEWKSVEGSGDFEKYIKSIKK